jgi:hypothetical protein
VSPSRSLSQGPHLKLSHRRFQADEVSEPLVGANTRSQHPTIVGLLVRENAVSRTKEESSVNSMSHRDSIGSSPVSPWWNRTFNRGEIVCKLDRELGFKV